MNTTMQAPLAPVYQVRVGEVAKYLGKSRSWTRESMRRGVIRSCQVGSEWRTSWDFVNEYVTSREKRPG